MAQNGALPAGKYGGYLRCLIGLDRTHGIDATVQRSEPSRIHPGVDHPGGDASGEQLLAPGNTMGAGDCFDRALDGKSAG